MKQETARRFLAMGLVLAVIWAPGLSLQAGTASLGKVVPRGAAELNRTQLEAEATLYSGDTVSTPAEGLALILLPRGSQIHLGPSSAVEVRAAEGGVVAGLAQGSVLARSESGQTVSVWAANLQVSPQAPGTLYQVALADSGAVVSAERGTVLVAAANRTVAVAAGETRRFEAADSGQAPVGAGAGGMSTATATGIAVGISLGIAIPVGWIVSNKLADDARKDACAEAIRSVSAALPTSGCT